MKICFAIPARIDSTRIPRKMLLEFDGKPLIRKVFDEVSSWGMDTVVVTDSREIQDVIPPGRSILTGDHENGTARLASLSWDQYDYVINIQGDMIDIKFETISDLFPIIQEAECWTFYTPGSQPGDVKLIHDFGVARWFTRHPIGYGDRHLGIYAYTPEILADYKLIIDKYPQENLEQLRILGWTQMGVIKTKYNGFEINTEKDVDRWIMQCGKRVSSERTV